MDYIIRELQQQEVPQAFQLLKSLVEHEGITAIFKADVPMLEHALFSKLPRAFSFCVVQANQLIGISIVTLIDNNICYHQSKSLYIEELYIKPEFQRRGIGTQLIKHLARFALKNQCSRMDWMVVRGNENAVQFYEKLGAKRLTHVDPYRFATSVLEQLAYDTINEVKTSSMDTEVYALQDLIAPDGVCFGCGSKNRNGLQIKSYWDTDNVHVVMTYIPDACYVGWPSLVYGGLISCLIDCHSNWTVMAHHYRAEGRQAGTLPRIDCVTGFLGVKYIKPTPMGVPLTFKARVEGEVGRKTRVLCEVYDGDTLTVTGDSIFVRVDVGHLAKTAHTSLKE